MAFHGPSYGLTREAEDKQRAAYDTRLEGEIVAWIESQTGERKGGRSFHEFLKSGVVLCKLVGARSNSSSMPFKIMENIGNFLDKCRGMGMQTSDLFQTVDLYEAKNMTQVLLSLAALKRTMGGGRSGGSPAQVPVSTSSPSSSSPVPAPAPRPAPASASGPKFCPQCGAKSEGARFCAQCGEKLF